MNLFDKIFVLGYEGNDAGTPSGEGGGNGGQNGDANGGGQPGGTGTPGGNSDPDSSVTSQEHLNRVAKKLKDEYRDKEKKLLAKLENVQKTAKMGEEERKQLDQEIEELRTRTSTAEENARREREKLEKKHKAELENLETESKTWKSRYNEMHIGNTIKEASLTEKVLPQSIQVMEALLKPNTHLAEVKDEEGNFLGFEPKVKMQAKDDKENTITIEVSVQDAIKRMKEDVDQYGNLFEGTSRNGLGGSSSAGGGKGKIDQSKISTEEYIALRKKDRDAAYGS